MSRRYESSSDFVMVALFPRNLLKQPRERQFNKEETLKFVASKRTTFTFLCSREYKIVASMQGSDARTHIGGSDIDSLVAIVWKGIVMLRRLASVEVRFQQRLKQYPDTKRQWCATMKQEAFAVLKFSRQFHLFNRSLSSSHLVHTRLSMCHQYRARTSRKSH